MQTITKTFNFCYGHRVDSQDFDSIYNDGKCRFLHGHDGCIELIFDSKNFDESSLNWFENFLINHVDYKFLIDKNDPIFYFAVEHLMSFHVHYNDFSTLFKKYLTPVNVQGVIVGWNVDTTSFARDWGMDLIHPNMDVLKGYFVVDFSPTGENLVAWVYKIISNSLDQTKIQLLQVNWHESQTVFCHK